MTNEKLDEARADEALRIWANIPDRTKTIASIAARLAREGWVPTPDHDDLTMARRICLEIGNYHEPVQTLLLHGRLDHSMNIRIAMEGIKRGRANVV